MPTMPPQHTLMPAPRTAATRIIPTKHNAEKRIGTSLKRKACSHDRAVNVCSIGKITAACTHPVSAVTLPAMPTKITRRDQIKQTPIEKRPYRPLHIYGNAVRRRQSRGGSSAQR